MPNPLWPPQIKAIMLYYWNLPSQQIGFDSFSICKGICTLTAKCKRICTDFAKSSISVHFHISKSLVPYVTFKQRFIQNILSLIYSDEISGASDLSVWRFASKAPLTVHGSPGTPHIPQFLIVIQCLVFGFLFLLWLHCLVKSLEATLVKTVSL